MKAMKWEREFAALERMTATQLRQRYGEVFGEETNGRNKAWLVKRIAWRLQAKAEGASPAGNAPSNWPTRPTCA